MLSNASYLRYTSDVCNFTLTHEQFTCTCMELLGACALLPDTKLLDDLQEWFLTWLCMLGSGTMS